MLPLSVQSGSTAEAELHARLGGMRTGGDAARRLSAPTMWMRRDRQLVAVTLATVFAADVYFVLLPRLRERYAVDAQGCPCLEVTGGNSSRANVPATPWLSNASVPPANMTEALGVTSISTETGGEERAPKLERLFTHPLYNFQSPDLGEEGVLLQPEELMIHYRRKVSRWER